MTMVEEAVAWVVGDAEGLSAASSGAAMTDEPRPVTRDELVQTLAYALRFSVEGKPRRTGHEFSAHLAAAQLADHLLRSNCLLVRAPPPTRRVRD
jgi:hypothetical protein